MLAWKAKVADRLARLLADSPASPSSAAATPPPQPATAAAAAAAAAVEPQATPFPVEHFTSPKKGSLSSYVMSLLPTSNPGHERTSPSSQHMKPLPPESLPKRWRGNDFLWHDPPLALSEESGSESERDERNGNSNNEQILQSHRPIDNSNGNEETSTSDCTDSLYYLTEKSTFISPKLFGFFQSSLPGTLKGCHWVLLYSAALGSMEHR